MAKQKKPSNKRYDITSGRHEVSADGTQMKIGNSTFKRTVLPSSAQPCRATQQVVDELDELDSLQVKEADTD